MNNVASSGLAAEKAKKSQYYVGGMENDTATDEETTTGKPGTELTVRATRVQGSCVALLPFEP